MVKETKGIQISQDVHAGLELEKLHLAMRKKTPNITFEEVIRDMLERIWLYENILYDIVEAVPEARSSIEKTAKELEASQYVKDYILSVPKPEKRA